jgi:uncharacterized membrane protein
MVIILTGLVLTWTAYFSHSQKLSHDLVITKNGVSNILGATGSSLLEIRTSLGFKKIAFLIAQVPLGIAEKVLLIMGGLIVIIGYIFLVVSITPKKFVNVSNEFDTESTGCIKYLDIKSRECIFGLFMGTIFLLISFPILHIWSIYSENNISGPMGISLILSITGLLVVIIYMIRMPSIRDDIINNKLYWIWMNIVIGVGIFMGTFSSLFGSLSFVKYGDYRVGLTFLICSVVLVLAGFIIGLVGYAKQRRHIWELETIIGKRTDILQRKRTKMMNASPNVKVVNFV